MLVALLAVWGTLFHRSEVRAAENTVTVGVWIWEGSVNDSWFESGNWRVGDLFQAPTPNLPVSFGPTQLIINGFATDTYFMPKRGAVLSADFRSPRLTMRNFDGICELTVRNGATYTVDLATVGRNTADAYVPAGPVVPPRLRLVDAHLAGKWVIGGDAPAILDVEGSASVGNLVLAESAGSSVVVNLHPGAGLEQRGGTVAIGSGTVLVENHGEFIQRGAWSGTVAGWTNRSGSGLRLRSMGFRSRIENQGLMTFAEGSGEKHMQIAGRVTLTGGGEVRLNDGNSRLTRIGTDAVLVNVDNVIRGGWNARIGVEVVNEHVLRVEEGLLHLDAPVDNRAGVVEVGAGGRLEMGSSTLAGRVAMTAGGVLNQGALKGARIEGVLTVGGGGLVLREAITNQGVITFGGRLEGQPVLRVDGVVTLSGGGELVLVEGYSRVLGSGDGAVLVNVDNAIRGGKNARIGVRMANEHLIRVEEGSLYVEAPLENAGGIVEVADGGRLELSSTLTGGEIRMDEGGVVNGGILEDCTCSGVLTAGGGGLTWRGGITNRGSITVAKRAGPIGFRVDGTVVLEGGGDVLLPDINAGIFSARADAELVNRDNTLRGGHAAVLDVVVSNGGTILAEAGRLRLARPVRSLDGARYGAAGGAVLEVGGGGLDLPRDSLLFGDGTLQSGIRTLGVIAPGSSIGVLSIAGDLTLGGTLRCEVAGASSDRLVVAGRLVLENAVLEVEVGPDGLSHPAYVLAGYQELQGSGFAKVEGMPAGYVIDYAYQGRQIAMVRAPRTRFQEWAEANGLREGEGGLRDDPNHDGVTNLEHFAFGTDPKGAGGTGRRPLFELVSEGGNRFLTLTFPVLEGAVFSTTPVLRASVHGLRYSVFGGERLGADGLEVGVAAIERPAWETLPDHDGDGRPDWSFRRFRLNRPIGSGSTGFLWVEVTPE